MLDWQRPPGWSLAALIRWSSRLGCRVGREARAAQSPGAGGLPRLGGKDGQPAPVDPGLPRAPDPDRTRESGRPRPRLPAVTQGPAALPRPSQAGLLREHLSEGSRCPAGVAALGDGCVVGVRRGPDHPRGRRKPLDSVARGRRPALMGSGRVPGPPPRCSTRLASARPGPEFFIHLFRHHSVLIGSQLRAADTALTIWSEEVSVSTSAKPVNKQGPSIMIALESLGLRAERDLSRYSFSSVKWG